MPERTLTTCSWPGCARACHGRYCEDHARLAQEQPTIQQRPSAAKRGYGRRWRKASQLFLSHHPWCATCGAPATDVDHITPHSGDQRLFWAVSNWQPLCARCHGRKSATEGVRGSNHEPIGLGDHATSQSIETGDVSL